MNGNIKFVDNAPKYKGKRKKFVIIANVIVDLLQAYPAALNIYLFLMRQAGGTYNANRKNITRNLHIGKKTLNRGIATLEEYGLLKRVQEKEITKETMKTTMAGDKVPNQSWMYTVYSFPTKPQKGEVSDGMLADIAPQSLLPETISKIPQDWSSFEEDLRNFDEDIGNCTNSKCYEDVTGVVKAAPIPTDSERTRENHLLGIATKNGVFGTKNQKIFLDWCMKYKRDTGRAIADGTAEWMATILSNNSAADFTNTIKKDKQYFDTHRYNIP